MQTGKLPKEIDYKAPISSLLVGSTFWKEAVFDHASSGISRMQVDTLFLSLTASGMIQMQLQNPSLEWTIAHEYNTANDCFIESHIGRPIYRRDDVWRGNTPV